MPATSPAAAQPIDWVDGLDAILEYLNDRCAPHTKVTKHRLRALLDQLEDPPRSWPEDLVGRVVTGRAGVHGQTRSVDRLLLEEIVAGKRPTVADAMGFVVANVVPIRRIGAEGVTADEHAAVVAERDRLAEAVEELTEEVGRLRRVVRDQAVMHAQVIAGLTREDD